MSYTKIYIHAVWGTKRRQRVLTKEIRERLINFIKDYCKEKDIHIIEAKAYLDHVHCLFILDPQVSLSKTMQYLKGGSSYWINKNKLLKGSLQWSHRYYAASISEEDVSNVATYIRNQENHHNPTLFSSAYKKWLKDMEG